MTEPLIWREETRKLTELKPYTKNPRRITKIEFEKLKDRIKRLGYHTRIKIDIDNTMNDGHQKWKALQELGMFEVPILAPNRKLTEEEFDEILIESNTHSGVWDAEILANNWEAPQLVDWNVDVPGLFEVDDDKEENNKLMVDETHYTIIIECLDEQEQSRLYTELEGRGIKCKLMM
jgi:ParB-like chromosome segregation protein Spo0J